MDFSLSEQQKMLQTAARQFLTDNCPKAFVRQMVTDERGYSQELWGKIAQLGWLGLVFPEKYGGARVISLTWWYFLRKWDELAFLAHFFLQWFSVGYLSYGRGLRSKKRSY